MSLNQIQQGLLDTIILVKSLILSSHKLDSVGGYIWSKEERAVIIEATFLRLFKAWEAFLENSFQAYMIGAHSLLGHTIVSFVRPRDVDHAHEMAIGTRPFVDWSTPDTVRRLSIIYFEQSNPFEDTISSIHGDLNDMKTIRNAAAHLSSTTSAPLDSLATRKLRKAISGITVYDLVLAPDPATTGKTVIEYYMDILSSAAHQITHA